MSPEDTLRQQSFVILSRLQSGTESVVRLDAALAMIAEEREACAKIADASAERMRKLGQRHRDEWREDSMGRCYARARQCTELAADIRKRAVEIDRTNDGLGVAAPPAPTFGKDK